MKGGRMAPDQWPGEVFGYWKVVRVVERGPRAARRVEARCVCGETRTLHVDDLRRGGTLSCGCMKGAIISQRFLGRAEPVEVAQADVSLSGVSVDGVALTATEVARFRASQPRDLAADACWPWRGGRSRAGYGRMAVGGRRLLAHRVAIVLATRETIPRGLVVCHHCDNPPCVNPAHLFVGTQNDNVQDAVSKGRIASGDDHGMRRRPERRAVGERHGSAKLTAEKAELMRRMREGGATTAAIGEAFGVSQTTAADVVSGRTWRAA